MSRAIPNFSNLPLQAPQGEPATLDDWRSAAGGDAEQSLAWQTPEQIAVPTSPPNRVEWEWDWPSATTSSGPSEDGSGMTQY